MKTKTPLSLICCCLLLIASTGSLAIAGHDAQGKRHGPPHGERHDGDQTRLLKHLLEMEDKQLANLRQTIERIEKMPIEEKARLRERIGTMHKMDPKDVQAMREKYEAIPKAQREAMRQSWSNMTPEERSEWRHKFRNMTAEERDVLLEAQAAMPPLPRKDKKRPRPSAEKEPAE